MFFGKAEAIELDSQGRLLIPQRLRSEIESVYMELLEEEEF